MPETVGIGIIGCGGRVRTVAGWLTERFPRARVVALMDTNPDSVRASRERLNPEARGYEDYRALVAAADVQWVMIGSWNAFHAEHAVAALDAGKHVFCEKPLATSLEDCLAMRDAVDKSGRIFSFGLTLRYAALYRRVRKIIDDGGIGTLLSFEFNENLEFNHGGFIHADWRRHRKHAGTHLLEKCCHDIDIGNWFAGSVAKRAASFGGRDFFKPENERHRARLGPNDKGQAAYGSWSPPGANPFTDDKDIVDNQVALLEYRNGVRAMFHTNCNAALNERRILLLGSEGAIRADLISGLMEHRRIGWDEPIVQYRDAGGGHGDGDVHLVKNLADSMFEGKAPAAGIREGVTSALTCFGIDQALDTGSVVDLEPMWQRAGW